jgi:hypothetical protein
MNNRQRLIDLITEFKLERRDVAELLKVKRDLVDRWLVSPESKHRDEIPEMAIELLELKLGAKPRQEQEQGS